MPEILEIEFYRRLALGAIGRRIREVDAPDAWYLKGGISRRIVTDALVGNEFVAARRIGKLLLLDVDEAGGGSSAATLGLRFGMTGVLEIDDAVAVERLEYASARRDAAWYRFAVGFDDGGWLRVRDPRRLGAVELDPSEGRLGPDAFALTAAQLRRALDGSGAPLKARLMDQQRVAGLGNLLTDEILWRSGLDPARPAGSLDDRERRRLLRRLRQTLDELLARGGSHRGDLQAARQRGAYCPRDGTPLERRTIGGRTTYSCPVHQH